MDFTVKNSMIAADFTSFLFNMKQHSKIKNGGRCETDPNLHLIISRQSALLPAYVLWLLSLCCKQYEARSDCSTWSSD